MDPTPLCRRLPVAGPTFARTVDASRTRVAREARVGVHRSHIARIGRRTAGLDRRVPQAPARAVSRWCVPPRGRVSL